MSPIPDPPCGLRFCRQCNEFKPLSEFPAGKRRYQCRKHAQERQADVAELFRECDVEPCHRVLPADPLRALAGDNAVVVSREARKKLIREWLRNGNVGQYGAMLLVEAGSLDTEAGNNGAAVELDGASRAAASF
uniref:Uncharacterized protein n=1 Tax=Hemiselmis andersenii TaxID=464988 RepID=A0A6U4XKB5_HEMAN|mmetsp:Transcript_35455/g.86363  ORF Transcript_35455/g.86363 Transcript_35455/m.86363 type:complete len:134 (+) Transcript_35455:249-650(+)